MNISIKTVANKKLNHLTRIVAADLNKKYSTDIQRLIQKRRWFTK